jgi:orotidine-5'-phosphate decarboxylase
MDPKERIILALDLADYNEAMDVVNRFKDHVTIFKVGSELFTSAGPKIVEAINNTGKKVFLDLKFHDIPNTVAKTVRIAAGLRVFMFNVHTLGGLHMMKQAAQELVKSSLKHNIDRPKLLGVTILTSINETILSHELGIGQNMKTQVRHLAGLAVNAGLDGVVASPEEIDLIRSSCGTEFLIVTPGIRPSWAGTDDQQRTMTPKEAIRKGADYIVIGRAILSQPDPIKALERIHKEMDINK